MIDSPNVLEIRSPPSVLEAFKRFADCEGTILFDSARRDTKLGRYSFLSASPREIHVLHESQFGVDPFRHIRVLGQRYRAKTLPGLPPFQGGFAGLLSYELGGCWERLPKPKVDLFTIPAMSVGLYDWVIAWDHFEDKCWVISHGFGDSRRRSASLCEEVERCLTGKSCPQSSFLSAPGERKNEGVSHSDLKDSVSKTRSQRQGTSNFTQASYLEAVQKVIDYIYEGDIFQANLSQRIHGTCHASVQELYESLRVHNPAPFAGLLKLDDWAVLSSSPERFIQSQGEQVCTRPIKGTRQRRSAPEADLFTRDELRESEKDRAENVMIVDLLRNDLSRVCLPGSIRVPELCSIEAYETVTHLVSEVTGKLRPEQTFWDVMRAAFPGGSITGAPKIRAMEIITELEEIARGAYCGSMFYCGFDGTADSNILIRTITKRGSSLAYSVGGGIVSQSIPQHEYEETLHKGAGIEKALKAIESDR